MTIRLEFFGGAQDGHSMDLPPHWDPADPPDLVWLHNAREQRTGYTTYLLTEEPPGHAYRFSGARALPDYTDPATALHYERFEQADEVADLHSG